MCAEFLRWGANPYAKLNYDDAQDVLRVVLAKCPPGSDDTLVIKRHIKKRKEWFSKFS